jgi:FkbM family methyltransferase
MKFLRKIKTASKKISFIFKKVKIRNKSRFYAVFVYLQIATVGSTGKYIPGVKKLFNRYRKHAFSDHVLIKNNIGFFHATARNDSFMKSMPFFEYYNHSWLDKADNKKVFVDIGANIGFFTLMAMNNKGFQTAITIEPTPDTFKRLKRNVVANELEERVRLYNKAIGKESAQLKLQQNEFHTGGNAVIEESNNKSLISVEVVPFTDILEESPDVEIADIGFIKIDVEGFELNVLRGMKNVLEELASETLIFIEIRKKDENPEAVKEILSENSFKVIDSKGANFLYKKLTN